MNSHLFMCNSSNLHCVLSAAATITRTRTTIAARSSIRTIVSISNSKNNNTRRSILPRTSALPSATSLSDYSTTTYRTMSSSSSSAPQAAAAGEQPQKCEWLVIFPDQPNALERRLKARPLHLQNLEPTDFWQWGGSFLEEPPKEGETPKMLGSALLVWAASKEEVLDRLRRDVYTTGDVWDWEKMQIWPFKSALRKAL